MRITRQTGTLTRLLNKAPNHPRISRKGRRGRLSRRPLQEEVHRVEAFARFTLHQQVLRMPILKRYLGHLKSDTPGSLSIGNGKIGRETGVSNYRRQRITMLVGQPLTIWTHW
jgi:hypothetical protein